MKGAGRARSRDRLDARLSALKPPSRYAAPQQGWIRTLRDAIGMTGSQLGRRMGTSAQAVVAIERSEASGRIRLDTLGRAAAAMDCVLVYALVPRTGLREMVDARARELALDALGGVREVAPDDHRAAADLEQRIEDYIDEALRDRDLWER